MKKVKLQSLVSALSMTAAQIAMEIEKMSGKVFPRQLMSNAVSGQPIPALKAKLLCQWLSREFGHEIQPEDISDLKIHAFSTLPDSANESVSFQDEKIAGFLAGFSLAFNARSRNRMLSNAEACSLAEQATMKRLSVFQESAGGQVAPLKNANAYQNACTFAINGVSAMLRGPKGNQKYAELQSWLPVQREHYARQMAEDFLPYL